MKTTVSTRWGCPDSKLVLRADAPREEWLGYRTKGVGGSDVSAILGFSKWASGYGVWLDKTGRGVEQEENQAMRMGNKLEPIIKELFTEDTGIKIRAAGLHRSKHNPILQVSVDGLTEDGGLVECKSTSGWLREEWEDGQVPDHAELQAQHGLGVTGRSHAYILGLIDGREFIIRRIERDQAMIDNLDSILTTWWAEHVLADVAPPVTAISVGEIKARWPDENEGAEIDKPLEVLTEIRSRYDAAKDLVKKYESEAGKAEAELRELAGPAVSLTADGKPFATFKSTGTFASTKFKETHPDKAEEYTIQKSAIDTARLKTEDPHLYNQFRSRVLRFPKAKKD